MEPTYFSSRHPLVQLLFAALIILISYLALTLVTLIPGLFIFGVSLSDWASGLEVTNPANVPFLKYVQITQAMALFIIPPVLIGWFDSHRPWRFLGIDRTPTWRLTGISIGILAALIPLVTWLGWFNENMQLPSFLEGLEMWMANTEQQLADLTEAFLGTQTLGSYLVNVLMIVILAGFGEEFFFRGVIQKLLWRWFRNPHWAIVVASVIFSAFHLQFYGFLPRLVLGLLFGYLYYWSGSLWYAIIPHVFNNLIPVTLGYLAPEQFASGELKSLGNGPNDWIWVIPATLVAVAGIYYFYRETKRVTSDE